MCGEEGDAPDCDEWVQSVLLPTIRKYHPKDVYNCDETALFYQALPRRTVVKRGTNVHGSKASKKRLTLLLTANADGSHKFKPMIIGSAQNPRCFSRKYKIQVSALPVTYEATKKAWMNGDVFKKYLEKFNACMKKQRRKVLLVMDNAPCHPKNVELSNVELLFLPAHSTSKIQPMDAGIINSVKARYRGRIVSKLLSVIEKEDDPLKVMRKHDIKKTIDMLAEVWKELPVSVIQNCFRHARFTWADPEKDQEEQEDEGTTDQPTPPEAPEEAPVDKQLWKTVCERLDFEDDWDEYVRGEEEDTEIDREMTEEEIVQYVKDMQTVPEEEDPEEEYEEKEDDIGPVTCSSQAIDIFSRLKAFFDKNGMDTAGLVVAEKEVIGMQVQLCTNQIPVSDYFKMNTPLKLIGKSTKADNSIHSPGSDSPITKENRVFTVRHTNSEGSSARLITGDVEMVESLCESFDEDLDLHMSSESGSDLNDSMECTPLPDTPPKSQESPRKRIASPLAAANQEPAKSAAANQKPGTSASQSQQQQQPKPGPVKYVGSPQASSTPIRRPLFSHPQKGVISTPGSVKPVQPGSVKSLPPLSPVFSPSKQRKILSPASRKPPPPPSPLVTPSPEITKRKATDPLSDERNPKRGCMRVGLSRSKKLKLNEAMNLANDSDFDESVDISMDTD